VVEIDWESLDQRGRSKSNSSSLGHLCTKKEIRSEFEFSVDRSDTGPVGAQIDFFVYSTHLHFLWDPRDFLIFINIVYCTISMCIFTTFRLVYNVFGLH
jgi:hypothetical protein